MKEKYNISKVIEIWYEIILLSFPTTELLQKLFMGSLIAKKVEK